jgi:uncharacterized protein YkwD
VAVTGNSAPVASINPPPAQLTAPEPVVEQAPPEQEVVIPLVEEPQGKPLTAAGQQSTPGCINKAAFFEEVSIPSGTAFKPGETFVKIWKVRNEGTCAWGPGYKLFFVEGDPLGAALTVPLPAAQPREVVDVSVAMVAPSQPGAFRSVWGFETPEGQSFGTGSAGLTPLEFKIGVRMLPPAMGGGACSSTEFNEAVEQELLDRINAERALNNLPPLVLDENISLVSRGHSLDMACRSIPPSHQGSDGSQYPRRLTAGGIEYATSNEIIFNGNGGTKFAVFWWVHKSKTHHDIIMDKRYTRVGVGFVHRDSSTNYKEFFTVNFIKP